MERKRENGKEQKRWKRTERNVKLKERRKEQNRDEKKEEKIVKRKRREQ